MLSANVDDELNEMLLMKIFCIFCPKKKKMFLFLEFFLRREEDVYILACCEWE